MSDTWILKKQADDLEESCLSLEDWQAEWLWKHPTYQDGFFYGTKKEQA